MKKTNASGGPCTLRIAVVGGPQYDRLYERLALFERETGHHVEIVFRGSHPELNDYLTSTFQQYDPAFSAESPIPEPDLDLVSTHIKYAPSQAYFLQDLGDDLVSAQEQSEFLESAMEASKVQGKLMQLPRMVDSRVLFYRADIFERLGLAAPRTWQDLLTVASKVRKAALPTPTNASGPGTDVIQGYVFPGKQSGLFGTFYELAMMEMEHSEALFDQQSRPVFQESVVANVLRYMRELVTSNAVPQDIEEYYFDEVSALFSEGKVAMVADWPSFYEGMKAKLKSQEPDARIKVMRYPVGANGKRSAYSGMHSFAIPKSCRHREEAAELLKFLVRDDQQWIEASESGSFPTKKAALQRLLQETEAKNVAASGGSGSAEQQLDSERLNCLVETVQNDMAMFPHLRSYPELEDALYPMIQDAMMGRISPEEAARRMQARAMQSV
ncbi:hypothetical protein BC939DRAFT_447268 [Gamsiella multidivaricata]|uniref:uncharacterized protein n=1 Tax=Gamsiella multidivaricata TaxID=101098 RepID=UPI00221F8198|nr:uncharacterized protein BC939DRAFT_447268 [Gamsiella multidivaricata]KAI7826206.1 hypothetical protein BC939DRAFT_447268 [Gamsiella multidivaricata]